MNRRDWLKWGGLGAGVIGVPCALAAFRGAPEHALAQEDAPIAKADPPPIKKGDPLKITDIKTFLTAPAGIRLVIVKVLTSEPGLYGLGCATFTQRARVVETAVDKFLRPFLIGKDPNLIEDTWQSCFVSSYWRNGPVLNNAISGVDMALWDILGKRTGQPLYQLLGGKCRRAVDTYKHTSGTTFLEVEKAVRAAMEKGWRHIRVQIAVPGLSTYGASGVKNDDPMTPPNQRVEVWEPRKYVNIVPKLFEHLRKKIGDDVELLHDMHERVPPILAMQLVRDLEQFKPYFVEDPFSPEDIGYFSKLRPLTSTPLAMGELFNNPNEWVDLISQRLIDFIRIHISQIGGITPARKVAALADFFGVRTAWHGPGDVSPVGHAANVHLDLAIPNFGIQEGREFTQEEKDVFPGCPDLKGGWLTVSDKPGLGIDIDEKAAAKFPFKDDPPFDLRWGQLHRRDGSITKP